MGHDWREFLPAGLVALARRGRNGIRQARASLVRPLRPIRASEEQIEVLSLRRYRRRIERVMELKCPQVAQVKEQEKCLPWRYLGGRVQGSVMELAFEVPEALSFKDIESQKDAIASICGTSIELVNQVGAVKIRIFTEQLPLVLEAEEKALFDRSKGFLMGIGEDGEPIYMNFEHPHMIVAGETGWGKTVWLILFLAQVVEMYEPNEAQIMLIDLKGTDFIFMEHVPHMLGPIRSDLPHAAMALSGAVAIMRERQEAIQRAKRSRQEPPYFLKLFVVIDEAANIAPSQQGTKEEKQIAEFCDSCLSELARIGRSLNVHILYCTQYPRYDVCNAQLRINAGARLCFYVPVPVASEVVLDRPGAEELPCKGRAIYRSEGKYRTLQVPYGNEAYWQTRIEAKYPWKEAESHAGGSEEGNSDHDEPLADHLNGSGSDFFPLVEVPGEASE